MFFFGFDSTLMVIIVPICYLGFYSPLPPHVQARDRYGNSALHLLCLNPTITLAALAAMLGLPEEGGPAAWLDPESSSSRSGGHGARAAPLLLLAAANRSGNLPLHYLATNPAVGDHQQETPADVGPSEEAATNPAAGLSGEWATQRGAALLTLVAQKHLAAAATVHAHGSLPLHLLCKNSKGLSLASLEALIAAHPQVHFFSRLLLNLHLLPILSLALCSPSPRVITETKQQP